MTLDGGNHSGQGLRASKGADGGMVGAFVVKASAIGMQIGGGKIGS